MNLVKKRPPFIILFTIPLLLSCQLLSRFQPNSAESPPVNQGSTIVLEERGDVATIPADVESDPELEPTVTPAAVEPTKSNAPPPLPSNNSDGDESTNTDTQNSSTTSGAVTFVSPAGYELIHFADWFAADYFGQTIISNSEATLELGGNLIDQPIILIASGDTAGVSAPGLLNSVQGELLIDGQLAPVSPVIPLNRPSASGVRSVQRLILPEGRMEVTTEVLINGDLYTVAIGLLPEGASQNERDSMRVIMESITHLTNTFNLTAADYGLTAEGVMELNGSLLANQPLPTQPQPISFGVNRLNVDPGNIALLSFSLAEQTDISLIVAPSNSGLDLAIDLLNEAGQSILLGEAMNDNAGAGLAERLDDIQLEAGTYRVVVMGFGLTGGSITVDLR